MGLLSFLKSATSSAAPAARPVADAADDVQQLRLRARRRLIGAAVLVGLGVIGFPLVFETQPRPIPVDLPIDIPRKEAALPLVIPAPTAAPASAVAVATPPVAEPMPEPAVEAAAPAPAPVLPAAKVAVDKPKPVAGKAPETKPDAARVQALLDGKAPGSAPAAPANGGRFIVQVGAYADTKAAQDVRAKVEKLGLKTYTQAVDTADGRRIRVRVGPFASRDEADKVAAKVASGGGLKTVVLTL